jgi:hypothetical protein
MTALGRGRVDLNEALRVGREANWLVAELSHTEGNMLHDLAESFGFLTHRFPAPNARRTPPS